MLVGPVSLNTFQGIHLNPKSTVLNQYGLPKDNFISLLLAFNIGVEIGQLSVLIIAFIVLRLIFKKKWQSKRIRIPASIIIGLVGLFWFIERVFGL